jgi:hypothetical protein
MTTMVTELYDALRPAGAPEEKARAAAETAASYDREFADIKADLRVLKWAQSATFAGVVAVVLKLFVH